MANDISIEVQGLEQVMHRIRSLPDAARDEVLHDGAEYSLEVLRDEPPPKYVTRTAAYGQPFQSDRQRRWFFAALNSGEISVPYHRTGEMKAGWNYHQAGFEVKFTNSAPGAQYVMGAKQSRHEKLVGWKKAQDIVDGKLSFRSSRFRSVIMRAYQKAIRKLQLG
jgi:hypothetical protein